jgi:hypothetical protein
MVAVQQFDVEHVLNGGLPKPREMLVGQVNVASIDNQQQTFGGDVGYFSG